MKWVGTHHVSSDIKVIPILPFFLRTITMNIGAFARKRTPLVRNFIVGRGKEVVT